MSRMFGTDGVRGVANTELTPELSYRLGRGAGYLLKDLPGTVVVGRDTRRSGPLLEAALAAGLASVGHEVKKVGVVTTPAVAFLSALDGHAGGGMISASHNPFEYNGIKFFDGQGYKLPNELEDKIEEIVLSATDDLPRPSGGQVGTISEGTELVQSYLDHLVGSADADLSGMKVVVDCANGSASPFAAGVLERLGLRVTVINDRPDGININVECGSTSPGDLCRAVTDLGADLGLAFDGDADRLIAVDERGEVFDGDQIMATCAADLLKRGELDHRTVVATVMSNLGFEKALERMGVRLVRTRVGDRYVLQEMLQGGYVLGGEQSGHIIFRSYGTTGDGMLTAVRLLCAVVRSGRSLSDWAREVERYPQTMVNVKVEDKSRYPTPAIEAAVRAWEEKLDGEGRVLVRPSGTEPIIRVMVEGSDEEIIEEAARDLASVIGREI